MAELDLETVKHALEVAKKHGFAQVDLELGAGSFSAQFLPRARKVNRSLAAKPSEAPSAMPPSTFDVKSILVGFVHAPKRPLQVGDQVKPGDVVAVIEALGLENDITADQAGIVEELLFSPGQSVQFGQVLARLRIP